MLWPTSDHTCYPDIYHRSARFDVSLSFLLQQAAWLYERHFSQMRAQMKKLSPSTSSSAIVPDSSSQLVGASSGATAIPTGSQGPRAPSSLSVRTRDSPTPTAVSGFSGMIRPAGLSRTPSNRTVTQSKVSVPPSPRQRTIKSSFRNSLINQNKVAPPPPEASEDDSPPAAETSDSSSSDEGSSQSMARSQAFRRPPAFTRVAGVGISLGSDDEDDEEHSSGGFLPFAAGRKEDPAATLRSPPQKRTVASAAQLFSESSASSASSAAPAAAVRTAEESGKNVEGKVTRQQQASKSPADALSPRRRAELAKLSPRMRKEGSEGTPSMGSSFSDLDGEFEFFF